MDFIQVKDLKIKNLKDKKFSSLLRRSVRYISLISVLFVFLSIGYYNHNTSSTTAMARVLPTTILGMSFFLGLVGLIASEGIISELEVTKKEKTIRIVNKILEGQNKETISSDDIDKIITHLKVENVVTKTNKNFIKKIIISAILVEKYNRIISRIYQHNLLKPNLAIFLVEYTKNYYSVAKQLINLGIQPTKVYYESDSDKFALIVEDMESAHFAEISKDTADKFKYVTSNKVLDFISEINI